MGISSSHPTDCFMEHVHKAVVQPPPPEQSYTKTRIEQGLEVVAQHLHSKGFNAAIVTVGGAVNTLLLGTRASTGDVDFFYRTNTTPEDRKLVHEVVEAGKLAEKKLGLGDQWLNNHTVAFIKPETSSDLYAESVRQNVIVFSARGLTVYAAPWNYALLAKLDRAGKRGAKPYDMADAVDYLDRVIRSRTGQQPVKKSELKAWATRFKIINPNDATIDRLNKEYKAKHKKDGVVNG